MTNLHVHGLHVSPAGHGDNVFVHVMPGEEWEYEYQIPEDHPAGLFWYHPHPHGLTDGQVEGPASPAPSSSKATSMSCEGTEGIKERLLAHPGTVHDENLQLQYQSMGSGPTDDLRIRQGEMAAMANPQHQLAAQFINLHLVGHSMQRDKRSTANYLPEAGDDRHPAINGPGERAEVLILGGAPLEDGYALRSLPWARTSRGRVPTCEIALVATRRSPPKKQHDLPEETSRDRAHFQHRSANIDEITETAGHNLSFQEFKTVPAFAINDRWATLRSRTE